MDDQTRIFTRAADTELAWAAGFFDGEGSTVLSDRWLVLSVKQVERQPLERLVAAIGGRIYGPYPGHGSPTPIHVWRIQGTNLVLQALDTLWPYLSEPKRAQAAERVARFHMRGQRRRRSTERVR